jgi:hypothetical protein
VTEIERIYRQGIAEVGRWYRAALAAQVREETEDAEEAWERYEEALARVLLLSSLSGAARAHAASKAQGADWEPEEWPKERPATFAAGGGGIEPGTWWEAVRAFRSRIPKSWRTAKRLQKQAERLAAKIAKEESSSALDTLKKRLAGLQEAIDGTFRIKGATAAQATRIQNLIADAIEKKAIPKALKTASLANFIRRAQVEGIIGMTSARLETVYRTNVASAFNEATVNTMSDPAMERWAPLLRLVEIHDQRTRGAPGGVYRGKSESRNPGYHWQMDGYVGTAEDFRKQGLVPPNGFNCRGSLEPVTYDEAVDMGLVRKDGSLDRKALSRYNARRQQIIDRGLYPDPGFKR